MKYILLPVLVGTLLASMGIPALAHEGHDDADTLSQSNEAELLQDSSRGDVTRERCEKAGGEWVQTQSYPPQTRCAFPTDSRDTDVRPDSADVVRPADNARDATRLDRNQSDMEFLHRLADRVSTLFVNMLERLQAAIDRLTNIADRIASRIEKLETEHDISLDAAKEELARAERAIAHAQDVLDGISIDQLVDAIDTETDRTNIRNHYTELREAVREVRAAIFEAHEALVAAVREIKTALGTRNTDTDENEDATTSDTNNAQ